MKASQTCNNCNARVDDEGHCQNCNNQMNFSQSNDWDNNPPQITHYYGTNSTS